jgi:hypothetical protein
LIIKKDGIDENIGKNQVPGNFGSKYFIVFAFKIIINGSGAAGKP